LNAPALAQAEGQFRGYWSIDVSGPWRILFRFANGIAHEVHIHDPH
jgi:plasmid maintenance system killer protein